MSGVVRDLLPGELAEYGVSDPAHMVYTSYAGSIGSLPVVAFPSPRSGCVVPGTLSLQCDGVFNDLSPIRLASVRDGLGTTVFLIEKATSTLQELAGVNSEVVARRGWYVTGNWGDTLVTTFYPPNASERVPLAAVAAWFNSGSSLHPGGLNVAMGDGSVRFVKNSIQSWPMNSTNGNPTGASRTSGGWWVNLPQRGVWQSISTRSGEEVVGSDMY
jgi:prepilin-type processing-associated H-X9-DG protein